MIRETGSDGSTLWSHRVPALMDCPMKGSNEKKKEKARMEGFLQLHQMSKIGFSLPHANNRHPTRCHQSGRKEERDENKEEDMGLRK